MKFTEYITEASKYELQVYGVVQSLTKSCRPFIQELRKSGGDLLWRGTYKSRTKSIVQVTPRQDREPKDMPKFLQDQLDDEFKKKFKWRPRSEGVFVTARFGDAQSYGDAYMFFPVGRYTYLYNPSITDLFGEVEDNDAAGYDDIEDYLNNKENDWEDEWEYDFGEGAQGEWEYDGIGTGESDKDQAEHTAAEAEGIDVEDLDEVLLDWRPDVSWESYKMEQRDAAETHFDDFIKNTTMGYKNSNLSLAITRNVEIMFRCKSFYLVNRQFADAVRKYIIKGEKLDFDPKQSKLGFEKVPMTRRNIQKQKGHPDEKKLPWDFMDGSVSKEGLMAHHKKYMSILTKSHKGQQRKLPK